MKKTGKTEGNTGVAVKARSGKAKAAAGKAARPEKMYNLKLYVAGQTPKSLTAIQNLKKICEEHLKGQYNIEVIDILKDPRLAEGDQILAIPTLVRKLPQPIKKILGDLSDEERVLIGLDIQPRS